MEPAEFGLALPRPAGSVPEVEEAVRSAIREQGGAISFARFLEICLYHPSRGYYAAFGPETDEHARHPAADYFTSADLHPAFGHLLAREVAVHLERARRAGASQLWVVELGGGRGLLARDVLLALQGLCADLFPDVRYLLVEPNPGWAAVQRRNLLPEFEGHVRWVRTGGALLPLRGVAGVVLANEVLDALPFHLVEGRSGGPLEVFVAEDGRGGPLVERAGPVEDSRVLERLEQEGVELEPAQRGEVSLLVEQLVGSAGAALRVGALLAVDYGDEAPALYDPRTRPRGTLRCFFRHRLNEQPLERLGRQDITAHVDFTAAVSGARLAGLTVQRLSSQAEFLEARGLQAIVDGLERDAPRLERETYVRHRRALEALRDRRGLGGNRVLVAWR